MDAPSKIENLFPERLVLPSWVVPGTVAENALFLYTKVRQIYLCCFESEACLNYNSHDLPPSLGTLGLIWHVHLPLDLDWSKGPEEAVGKCLALRNKLGLLKPETFTLHPPDLADSRSLIETFAKFWYAQGGERLFIENTRSFDTKFLTRNFLENNSISFCLDMGHAIINDQEGIFNSTLPEYADMIHWNAPGKNARHIGLHHLAEKDLKIYKDVAKRLAPEIIQVLELFNWDQIKRSLPVLKDILYMRKKPYPHRANSG